MNLTWRDYLFQFISVPHFIRHVDQIKFYSTTLPFKIKVWWDGDLGLRLVYRIDFRQRLEHLVFFGRKSNVAFRFTINPLIFFNRPGPFIDRVKFKSPALYSATRALRCIEDRLPTYQTCRSRAPVSEQILTAQGTLSIAITPSFHLKLSIKMNPRRAVVIHLHC